jgi:hypothetical protein
MNGRYRIYLGLIALLAAVNVGRWVFAGASTAPGSREGTLLAEDFRLRVDVPGAAGHGRNLFAAEGGAATPENFGGGPAGKRGLNARPVMKIAPVSAPDPAQVMAASGLGKLRLLGVVFHGGKRQAYLGQDKENAIAAAGDTVFGQYAVDAISVDAVELRDLKTNLTRRIPVSGK